MAINFLWEIGLTLFIIFIIVLFIGTIILLIQARKNSRNLNKSDIYGYCVALFFFFIAIGYVIRVSFMFFIAKNYDEFFTQMTATERAGYAMPAYAEDGRILLLQSLWVVHMIFVFIGIGLLMFATEFKIYKKSHYFFTIIALAPLAIVIFLPYYIAQNFFYISYLAPLAWLVIYFNIARKATGSVRRNAIMLLLGFSIFVVGILFNSGTVRRLIFGSAGEIHVGEIGAIFSVWIAPIILTIGFIIMLFALLNKF
ncbi:MAG: hypothetical protein ACTSQJ_03230 [Promethearchaeota archaeon]